MARQLVDTLLRVVSLAADRELLERWFYSGNADVDFSERLYDKQRRQQWHEVFKPAEAFLTLHTAADRLLGEEGPGCVAGIKSYYGSLSAYVHSDDQAMLASAHPVESLGLVEDDDRYHADPATARWQPTAEFPSAMQELARLTWCFWEFFPRLAISEDGDDAVRLFPSDVEPSSPNEKAFYFVLLAMQNLLGGGSAISRLIG